MKLYYTDPLEMMPDFSPILTPEGHLLIAGGLRNGSNFTQPRMSICCMWTYLRPSQPALPADGGFGQFWL